MSQLIMFSVEPQMPGHHIVFYIGISWCFYANVFCFLIQKCLLILQDSIQVFLYIHKAWLGPQDSSG